LNPNLILNLNPNLNLNLKPELEPEPEPEPNQANDDVQAQTATQGGGGGDGGGGSAAAEADPVLSRRLQNRLPPKFLRHLDFWRMPHKAMTEELAACTCAAVHGGGDILCHIPAKIASLTRVIADELKENPESKFVVCCGFRESTETAAEAIKLIDGIAALQVVTVLAKGDDRAHAFADFQSKTGGKRVLCMESTGNCDGVNLFAANHLILLDSPKTLGVEAQLIGRVHRIGQDRDVTIHTIVVVNTVEARQVSKRILLRDEVAIEDEGGASDNTAACGALKWLISGVR
jgi:hypothetical protein